MTKKNSESINNNVVTGDIAGPGVIPPVVVKTAADNIWNDIKNVTLNMFALPAQPVSDYCRPVQVEPNKLYVVLKVPAVLPLLEEKLGSKYVFERHAKWISIGPRSEE